jgi:nicotinamidase-related amidase
MQVDAKSTVLVLIDLQKGVLAMPVAPHPATEVYQRSPEPLPSSDLVITKRQWGAFYGTELDLQLRRRGMRSIALGGIATNIGVESTARSAAEHGYELVIPEDLCSSVSAEMHAFTFKYILPRLARITTSDIILE